ncbi:MAG: flagellar assembly protein FliH [Selenomonadaceae bacterium]|nr:flagellar assembly protein FliH [Selenomonadaceae bacterium]
MYKNIVRYMTVGEPVIIGARPIPPVEETPPETVEEEPEQEPEPEPVRGIDQETLDKIYAEIEEIERKSALTKNALKEARDSKAEADKLRKKAEELHKQADELKIQAEKQLQDANSEADKLVTEAQAEAEKIINKTKHEAEELLKKVRKEAYDTGYADGKEDGIKDGKAHIERELAEIVRKANDKAQKTIRDAKEQTSEYFIRAEDDIVEVLMMAIDKILPQHFIDVPQVVLPVVREAIRHVRDQKEIKVHVEPDSYDLVLMARSEFQSMLTDGTAIIEIISDDALKPGDCVIETPNGGVDARLSTQLDLMKSALENVLNK